MKLNKLLLVAIAIVMALASESEAYFEYCAKGKAEKADYYSQMVSKDLLSYVHEETDLVKRGVKIQGPEGYIINKTIDKLKEMGETSPSTSTIRQVLSDLTIESLSKYNPEDPGDKRLDYTSPEIANIIRKTLDSHEVVGNTTGKYDRKGVEIGYCFGRATYVDLMLTRLGVDRDSIKKIWATGHMESDGNDWQFHVATIVRLNDGRWVAIDNVVDRIMDVSTWYKEFQKENKEKDLRLYVSDADKFSVSLGKYDPVQMGIRIPGQKQNWITNLKKWWKTKILKQDYDPRIQDWYKGYFADMIYWFKTMQDDKKLAKFLGLDKLPEKPGQ